MYVCYMFVCIYVCIIYVFMYVRCMYICICMYVRRMYVCTRVGPKVSGLTYKSHAKWKVLRGIYSAIYGETVLKKSYIYIYVYMYKYILKNNKVVYFCHLKKAGQARKFGPTLVRMYVYMHAYTQYCTYTCISV
jgi:hypothetical protein